MTHTLVDKVKQHWQVIKYLAVGGINTVVGLGVFAGLYLWLGETLHYLVIAVVANIIAISNAFLLYRYVVFESRGNFVAEYFRTYLVYGVSALLGLLLLGLQVEVLGLHPILAQVVVIVVTVLFSYFGHSRFTFAQPNPGDDNR